MLDEVKALSENVEHIKRIVAMQQTYARVSGIQETVALAELIESALRIDAESFSRHGVHVIREFTDVPTVNLDKHRALQIFVNLLQNAKHACNESNKSQKCITIRILRCAKEAVRIEVSDNGVGIAAENLTRIFSHGFTTRKDGHGFGLHSAALAAKEMQGMLTAQSAGPGYGATFVLELPLK